MRRIVSIFLAALLLAGCANSGAEHTVETTRLPGWSVILPEETGDESLQNGQGREDDGIVQEHEIYIPDTTKDQEETYSDSVSNWENGDSNDAYKETGDTGSAAPTQGSTGNSDSMGNTGNSGTTQPPDQTNISLADRRKLVADEMRAMMTLLWTPDRDITYYITGLPNSTSAKSVTLKKGTVYQGMPYTNGNASRYSFLSYATSESNGVYTLEGLTADSLSGNAVPRIGNSCSSALFWAWGKVSTSIKFTNTKMMTANYGCLKVGDYAFSGKDYGSAMSVDICAENGQQVMYAAYAQMQMGDGMVRRIGSGGHAIMVISVDVVYNADGTINGAKSKATIIDQSESDELNQKTKYISGVGKVVVFQEVDKLRTFNQLYESGYLPVTCKELVDPAPLKTPSVTDCTATPTVSNMFTGTIQATHRISSVTVTVTNSAGNTVQQATCYGKPAELYKFKLSRFASAAEQPAIQGKVDISALPAGTYRVVFTCRLSTGDNLTFRDFSIQK